METKWYEFSLKHGRGLEFSVAIQCALRPTHSQISIAGQDVFKG